VQEANARTAQAGPLAEARASQEVIEQQTALAERAAQLTEKQLESQVRRPADTEAYRQRTLAEANRDTIKLETEAEAFKQRALAEANRDTTKLNVEAEANRRRSIAEAEADATKSQAIGTAEAHKSQADAEAYAQRAVASAEAEAVRADALTDGNQALIAANKLIEILPQLVEAAAKGIAGSNLTVLSGTDGVNQAVAGMVGQGISIYETLRNALVNMPPPPKAEPADGVTPAAGKGAALSVARKPEER